MNDLANQNEPVTGAAREGGLVPRQTTPLIKYAGGKRWLVPYIGPGIARHLAAHPTATYHEPFVGGAALALWLGCGARMNLADYCEPLVNLYLQVRDRPSSLWRAFNELIQSGIGEQQYYEVRDSTPRSDILRAARMLYLTRLAFNGLWRFNRGGAYNVPFGDHKTVAIPDLDRIHEVSEALRGARVWHTDFEVPIRFARPLDVIYCDPPYYQSFDQYTPERFGELDQRRLGLVLHDAARRGVRFIQSNRDCAFIRDLYSWADIIPVAELRSINSDGAGRGPVDCVVVTNDRSLVDL